MTRTAFLLAMLISSQAFGQGAHDRHAPVSVAAGAPAPVQPGQSAFAAIQEIVELLEANRSTDWSKVDIEALRRHLIDMDNVTLHAETAAETIDGGMKFAVTGAGPVRESIRREIVD